MQASDDLDDDSSSQFKDEPDDSSGTSIKVAVRVRPFTAREAAKDSKCCISMKGNEVTLKNELKKTQRQFWFVHYLIHFAFLKSSEPFKYDLDHPTASTTATGVTTDPIQTMHRKTASFKTSECLP